jgi:phosphatidylglycerophosphatase A
MTGTVLGIGYLPVAPGTWASLVTILIIWWASRDIGLMIVVLVGLFILGIWAGNFIEQILNMKDPSCFVLDEVLGMGIALIGIEKNAYYFLMTFFLFRLFDIWKPFPISRLEKLPGGWGIMIDDLIAGIYANLWMEFAIWLVRSVS